MIPGALGHCLDKRHEYCGGGQLDRGDGTWVDCECSCHDVRCVSCHGPMVADDGEYCGECISVQAEYYADSILGEER